MASEKKSSRRRGVVDEARHKVSKGSGVMGDLFPRPLSEKKKKEEKREKRRKKRSDAVPL